MRRMRLGTIGVWAPQLRSRDQAKVRDRAAYLEGLGYGAVWVPGGAGGDLFADVDAALEATREIVVATGVLNIWMHDAADTAAWHAGTRRRNPGRMLLGLGASHASIVETVAGRPYVKPLSALRRYLDALDAAPEPVPAGQRVLAALGPRMLELAGERSLGAHPYLTGAEHTRLARQALGPGPMLAPELKVVLDTDPERARAVARTHLGPYLDLPNYSRNLLRTGFDQADLDDGGSDRLVDGVVAWGDAETIVRRAQEHVDAGADHVCVQVLTADRRDVPLDAWRELAPALLGGVAPSQRAS
ncbi:LLM class F420-dependent oxidoreductase [Pseudonocardia aurantiaca]